MPKSNLNICFVGGDKRQKHAARFLSKHAKISAAGECFSGCPDVNYHESPVKALYGADVIVLPLPASKVTAAADFDTVIEVAKKNGAYVLGGLLPTYMKDIMDSSGIHYADYYEDECFTLINAYLTAEGALNIIMNELETDIKSTQIAVLGYGRIGSALGEMLSANGVDVTVYARKREALTLASERGLGVSFISGDIKIEGDVIINTVPSRIISNEQLLSLDDGTLLIELASAPGGFDHEVAEQCGLKVIKAGGLPGKYAPISAGKAVADTLLTILEREALL